MKNTILLVDDEEINLDILVEMLSEYYDISTALSGNAALDFLDENKPDLILLDIMMPNMNGFEVCRKIRESQEFENVPVIFISALSQVDDIVEAFQAGGQDYIIKPFQNEEVLARVKTHIELNSKNRELLQKNICLHNLEKMRNNLVHMIVHDMRAILQGAFFSLHYAGEALKENNNEEVQQKINSANRSIEQITEMVSSLLDVNRMEEGKMVFNKSNHNLCDIAKKAIEPLCDRLASRNYEINLPDHRVDVKCDFDVVRRVVMNLVSNALKYTTPKDRIDIYIQKRNKTGIVYVKDSGPGIPEEFHQKIFEKFEQAPMKAAGYAGSSGLGLTFCKLAVEAHKGEIGLDSKLDSGSTFWFTLPLVP